MAKKVGLREQVRNAWQRLDPRPALGQKGENIAARELERRGYRILERRYRTQLGEIDLIAEDGGTLVIVEVKTRTRTDVVRPVDAVDGPKQRQLIRLAEAYIKSRHLKNARIRFDVVGVHLPPKGPKTVTVLKNAFTP